MITNITPAAQAEQNNTVAAMSATQSARVANWDACSDANPNEGEKLAHGAFMEDDWEEDYFVEDPSVICFNALKTVSMSELYDTAYAPRIPVIDNLIYPGTHLFVGAPKVGKSFLMAQIAYHVSMGAKMWGLDVKPGTVLYLALEDDYSRIQGRLSKMFGMEISENLHFSTMSGKVGDRLELQLNGFIRKHPDTKLIIIDTLQKIRENMDNKAGYADDYDFISRLKEFTDATGLCIMVVHHTRKQKATDPFEMISGSNGLLGAADGAFLLTKGNRCSTSTFLHVTGRDQADQIMQLKFSRENYLWKLEGYVNEMEGEGEEIPPDPLLERISEIVSDKGWCGNASSLHEIIGSDDYQPNTLVRKLNISVDRLYHEYGIRYENRHTRQGSRIRLSKVS